ncbi:hypothetical protein QFC24_001672 [Naganishia onofrii]|uniref:Uncharacterized protein n=1 Tax=Naganishia onofrii TaxID=1851511 RepID=A0ACC2XS02_9TREE|nr:hypothetical protein QFC24_001672 [Naganishia onofrii]
MMKHQQASKHRNMQLPRIPPPPRPATVTPPPPPTQLGHGDLLASFEDDDQVLPAASNPHLQMYNGPTADFGLTPALQPSPAALPSGSTSQTRDQQQQQHPPPPHVHARHPPRRLSQIFSSLGPASPPVVSDQAGNGYILPPHSSIPNLNQTPNQHPASSTSTTANTASNNNSNNDEFGAFTSASASATATAAIAGEARPQQAHRRLSSFEGLWNLVPGSVATFPRRSGAAAGAGSGAGAPERSSSVMTTEATTAMEDVFHEEKDEATQGSQTQTGSGFPGLSDLFRSRSRDPSTSAAPAAQSSSTPPLPPPPPPSSSSANTSKLSNVLGSTIKAASKWKTVRGPSSFHPVPPSSSSYLQEDPHTASSSTTTTTTRRTGYALRYPFIEDADDFLTPGSSSSGIPPTAKPFVITHTSPFAPSTSTTPSSTSFTSASLSPPRRGLLMGGPLSGAPGYRREDDYLGSTRPVSSFTNEVQAGASASAGGAGRRGKTAGKQNGQDQRIDAGAVVGNEGEDGKDENGITNGQNGNINGQGSSSREWTGTKLVGRREGTDVVLDQKAADAVSLLYDHLDGVLFDTSSCKALVAGSISDDLFLCFSFVRSLAPASGMNSYVRFYRHGNVFLEHGPCFVRGSLLYPYHVPSVLEPNLSPTFVFFTYSRRFDRSTRRIPHHLLPPARGVFPEKSTSGEYIDRS